MYILCKCNTSATQKASWSWNHPSKRISEKIIAMVTEVSTQEVMAPTLTLHLLYPPPKKSLIQSLKTAWLNLPPTIM